MNESNIGQTIKSVVSILCVIGIIACVIAGIALISQGLGAIGWPIMLVGRFLHGYHLFVPVWLRRTRGQDLRKQRCPAAYREGVALVQRGRESAIQS